MLRVVPWLVLALGALVTFLSFPMDTLLFEPNPTPELRGQFAEDILVADFFYRLGLGILALGVVWLGLGWAWRRARR